LVVETKERVGKGTELASLTNGNVVIKQNIKVC
jgi:hypothetical protein